MSYRVFGMVTVSALALALGACDKGTSSANGAADAAAKGQELGVVDLDRVATDLGWIKEMETNLKTLEQQFKNELQARQDQYGAEVQSQFKRYAPKEGDKLNPQQEQDLNQMVLVRRQVLGQLQQAAAQQFQAYKGEWIRRYREALQPVVRDVASAKKVRVVFTKTDTVMYVDTPADMTSAVTDSARARPPVLASVPVPQLPAVPELPAPGTSAATQPATGATAPAPATAPKAPAPKQP
jgi:Skp family chaperone for outer membrane proteins